jgi:hypothetical protein
LGDSDSGNYQGVKLVDPIPQGGSTVRTLLVLLAGLALAPSTLAASTRPQASLSMNLSSYRVLYGHAMTISGKLNGDRVAGRAVSLYAWRYGRSAPTRLAVVRTASGGHWSYQASPRIRTTYWASAGPTDSRKLVVGVSPALSVKVLPSGHVRAHVSAARSLYGRTVELQLRNTDGSWTTVVRKPVGRHSTAVIVRPLPAGTIRIAMSVNQAGAGYLGAATHALRYRPLSFTMHPVAFKVLYGHRVMLTGRLVRGGAGRHVTIVARPYGHKAVRVATVVTHHGGRFSVEVMPRIMTTYQARLGIVRPSAAMTVGVRPVMSISELSSGSLRTHVAAAKSFRGRMVKLQRRVGTSWQTVAKQPLRAGSTATFAVSMPLRVIRVAMSVNQAGAGYLGTTSHPFVYRGV